MLFSTLDCGISRPAIFTFFAFFLLLTAFQVYGGGGKDIALTKADALIKDKEYEKAILVLTDFTRNNPGRFDHAQERLRKIYKLREDFNRTADELIEILLYHPDDDEKILALSTKLYSLEKEDSPLLVSFVSRTREISQFNVNRNMLRDILIKGREQLDRNESAPAIQTYAGGMSFMRNDFFASGYGATIERDVIRETDRVNEMLASFQQTVSQAVSVSSDLNRAITSGDMARITQAISRFMPALDRLIELKNDLYTAANVFEQILDRLQANDPALRDRSHLAFLSVLINGRSGEKIQEGMLGAYDAAWRISGGSSLDALISFLERANTAAVSAFNAGDYASAAAAIDGMENYYNLSGQFFNKHMQFYRRTGAGSEQSRTITIAGTNVLTLDVRQYSELRSLNEANNALRLASNTAMRRNIDSSSLTRWEQGSITAAAAFAAEQQTRSEINRTQREIEEIISRASSVNTQLNAYNKVIHITNTLTAIEKYKALLLNDELRSAERYYTIANNNTIKNLSERRKEIEISRNLINGIRNTDNDGAVTISHYPAEALDQLTRMLAAISADLETGSAVTTQYRAERQEIASNARISKTNTDYLAVINEMTSLRNQGQTLAQTARSRSTQAEAYRQEADRLFRDAQTAYQRQDFELARERVTQAFGRINNSLEIQNSAALRSTWDSQLLNLGEAISRSENELIIVEVRNLVNGARTAYFAGNFQQAEDSLLRARSRWRVTNAEENEEVIYWLGIIRTALSVRSGRVIPPTAPLYAEMSQLLSQAQRSYEEGIRHINSGQRALGLAKFDEARQMTREIRLMFPVNQEAGILELRIEQFIDPPAFNASFEQRLRTAVAGTRQRSLESFADLQNLAEINPRYPNIRNIITQAEIDMGFRPPPPNPTNIARSSELTASVNRIIDGNISTLYDSARAQIDEAINLNPENTEAMRAKDRLLNRMSVPGTIVLSSEDEESYQRALREFQAGNNLIARALVERLMQNPRNRNITKLVELQRRLQSIL